MEQFIYPNELAQPVIWGVLIAVYPYITGLVAGSFIISSLAYAFGNTRYKKAGGIAVLLAFTFLLIASLPLIADLKQPDRAYEIFTRPHLIATPSTPNISPMAVFGYLLVGYIILMAVEIIFLWRADLVEKANRGGKLKTLWRILALGAREISEIMLKRDKKIVTVLAFVGIPLAALFHAYVGFLFGSMKSRVLWATPFMAVDFLVSAIVSGIALLIIVYYAFASHAGKLDKVVVYGLSGLLAWTLLVDLALKGADELYRAYHRTASWPYLHTLKFEVMVSTGVIEFIIGGAVPLVLLLIPRLRRNIPIVLLSSFLTLLGVLAYRWNMVIGGQIISRTEQGLLWYTMPIFGKEGLIASLSILAAGVFIFTILSWIFPWDGKYATGKAGGEGV
ncbi:hypothetical protein HRbin01_01284 [archaeon HR01]|nr:hypothetical protein HRbin01_01284 [archaeon HR01]